MRNQTFHIHSLAELSEFSKFFVSQLSEKTCAIIFLRGTLGAGKTALVKEIGKSLGITHPIQSPTYTRVQEYALPKHPAGNLIHMDFYQITDSERIESGGYLEIFQRRKGLFFVEWPDAVLPYLPRLQIPEENIFEVSIELGDDDERMISIL